ncbi:uncharacterized protein LOC124307967 [Neodiprion virginianus]|uniref:uncharacterized protein LOC124307967 n=1 Tax=Neodiprion virginianus TaxID=2961670 RepID=UPI001EE72003|nr:uncharacterized protein LOC124307967 [Neodiprion virginianus]
MDEEDEDLCSYNPRWLVVVGGCRRSTTRRTRKTRRRRWLRICARYSPRWLAVVGSGRAGRGGGRGFVLGEFDIFTISDEVESASGVGSGEDVEIGIEVGVVVGIGLGVEIGVEVYLN